MDILEPDVVACEGPIVVGIIGTRRGGCVAGGKSTRLSNQRFSSIEDSQRWSLPGA